MQKILITNAKIVNEGKITTSDLLIEDGFISKIASNISLEGNYKHIDAAGNYLIPGIIDDQVHFREPGLTHKANIHSESVAAVAGGVTTFMEMPNTVPSAITQPLLQDKYDIAAKSSVANYSFFMGTSLSNYDELMRTDVKNICGLKIFMGSSTGDMLVDDEAVLSKIFANFPTLIATHCEDDKRVKDRMAMYKEKYGEDIPFECHAEIRDEIACLNSSTFAAELARKHNTRLHILHISTEEELKLFTNSIPLEKKRITSEACVHHLWFDKNDYATLGSQIKCNPSIKEAKHKKSILEAVLDDRIDIIATDHAPHTWEEKSGKYASTPSGVPLVQHTLNVMLEFYHQGKISLEKIVEKMSHHPAICFQIEKRGFIREGYFADLALVDVEQKWEVNKSNLLYKCNWSPFEGKTFTGKITHTIVSGNVVYENDKVNESIFGKRLTFERN
jgi:dihydroorotase